MMSFLFQFFITYSIYSMQLNALFDIQDSLTILCDQFPLISTINDSSLECARLRTDKNIPSSDFNLDNPSLISLFVIIDQSSNASPVNITINFEQSVNVSSSINEIQLSLLVVQSNFTINNQTTSIYSAYDIPILHWNTSQSDTYDVIDLLQLDSHEYQTDTSMCQWNIDRWNRLFNRNSSYGYILKTRNNHLIFTLTNVKDRFPPSPYINILHCMPYKLATTEIILLICFGVLLLLFIVSLSVLHYLKNEDNLSQYFPRQTPDGSQISILSVMNDDQAIEN